jgi:ABC-type branched-subunit amino acid transport system substrate-binding protein
MKVRRRLALGCMVASLSVVAACGGSSGSSGSSSSKDPYVIGFVGPLSGPVAPSGVALLAGLNAAVDGINKSGGIEGRELKVSAKDDANDPAQAISAVRALKSEGAVVMYGPQISGLLGAVADIVTQSKLTTISSAATTATLVPAAPWIFSADIPPQAQGAPALDFAKSVLGKDSLSAGLISIDTPAGAEWFANVDTIASSEGAQIVAEEKLPVGATDVTVAAQKVINGHPDAILTQVTEQILVGLVPKLRSLGFDGPIISYHAAGSNAVLQQLNDPGVYAARSAAPLSDSTDTGAAFVQYQKDAEAAKFEDQANSNGLAVNGYVTGQIIVATLKACGSGCDAEKFHDAMADLDLELPGLTFGPVKYSDDDHQGLDTVRYYHWDGSAVVAGNDQDYTGTLPVN